MIGWRQNIWALCEENICSRLITRASHSFSGRGFRGRWCKWHPGDRAEKYGNTDTSWQHFYHIKTDLRPPNSGGQVAGGQVMSSPRVFASQVTWQRSLSWQCLTWVMGSFITSTSVTVPNWPKYSRSRSWLVCQLRPPTNSFPGAESELGVLRPLDSPCKIMETLKYVSSF